MPPRSSAATREGGGGNHKTTIKTQGLELTIPGKLPFSILRHIPDNGDLTPAAAVKVLGEVLGEDQMQAVWDAGLDIDQGVQLVGDIFEAAGVSAGESSASPGS